MSEPRKAEPKAMSEHSKEPWTIERDQVDGEPYKAGDRTICESWEVIVIRSGDDNGSHEVAREIHAETDARRIVACVNACAGIDTEKLERVPGGKRFLIITTDEDDS